jgi:hypothetical protein
LCVCGTATVRVWWTWGLCVGQQQFVFGGHGDCVCVGQQQFMFGGHGDCVWDSNSSCLVDMHSAHNTAMFKAHHDSHLL